MVKVANTHYSVNELIKNRWSPRSFSNEKVSEDILFSLFEAASWASSSRNEQPWRFIYGYKGQGENYTKIYDTLVSWNKKWVKSAPVLALGIAKLNSDYHNKPNPYAIYDLGQAVATMAIQAASRNIYIHQMGGFEKEHARQAFSIIPGYEPVIVIAIGYLAEADVLPEEFKELEEKPRSRYELARIVSNKGFKP